MREAAMARVNRRRARNLLEEEACHLQRGPSVFMASSIWKGELGKKDTKLFPISAPSNEGISCSYTCHQIVTRPMM
jgi:hypothetical protein